MELLTVNEAAQMLRLTPITVRRYIASGRPTGPDDRYWNIVGIGRSDGSGDVSSNKHTYLAKAYYAEASPPKER